MYPEAKMIPAMKIWKLPEHKTSMLSEICANGEYFLEEKKDGAYYQYEKTYNYAYLFGRSLSKKTGFLTEKSDNVPHIMDALSKVPANTILIGEIYYPGGTSKNVTSIMGCLPQEAVKRQGTNNLIHYYIHDIIEYDGIDLMPYGAEDRYKILKAMWSLHELDQYDFLELAQKVDVDLEATISTILKAGGEGAVLKKRTYPYTPDKRPAWSTIKIKQMDSIDLVCIGFCPPTREYTGKEINTWEYWEEYRDGEFTGKTLQGHYYNNSENMKPITKYAFYGWNTAIKIGAYDDTGKLIELGTVSSGLTDEIKEDMTYNPDKYLNRVCSLDCMSIDKKERTLRHPVFKEWRDDKRAEDCIMGEIFV